MALAFDRPRRLDSRERALISTVTRWVGALTRARRFEQEQRVAETLQASLMPEQFPQVDGWRFTGVTLAGEAGLSVGGDWYDVALLPHGSILLSVGDVTGRGPVAAGVMGLVRAAVRALALSDPDPASILEHTDDLLRGSTAHQLATAWVGLLDPFTGRWVRVGGPRPAARARPQRPAISRRHPRPAARHGPARYPALVAPRHRARRFPRRLHRRVVRAARRVAGGRAQAHGRRARRRHRARRGQGRPAARRKADRRRHRDPRRHPAPRLVGPIDDPSVASQSPTVDATSSSAPLRSWRRRRSSGASPGRRSSPSTARARPASRTGRGCRGRTGTARRSPAGARRAGCPACPAGAADRRSARRRRPGRRRLAVGRAGDHRAHAPAHRAPADDDPVGADGGELGADRGQQHRRPVGRPPARQAVREVGPHRRPRRRDARSRATSVDWSRPDAGAGEQQQRAAGARTRFVITLAAASIRILRASASSNTAVLADGCRRRRGRGARAHLARNWAVTSFWRRRRCPAGSRGRPSPTPAGRRAWPARVELVPARWAMSAGPTAPRQRIALCSTGAMTWRLAGASRSTA